MITLVDPFTGKYRQRIVDFAAAHRLPAIYEVRELPEPHRVAAAGRGAGRQDPQGHQACRFARRAVINMKTAGALGLTVPPSVLLRADQVIE